MLLVTCSSCGYVLVDAGEFGKMWRGQSSLKLRSRYVESVPVYLYIVCSPVWPFFVKIVAASWCHRQVGPEFDAER
jgi:hypothetical protein